MALSAEVKQLVDGPNFAHLATLMSDGSPQSVPVWIGREGEHLIICTGEGSLKAKNTKRDPRVSLSVVAMDNPYREAQIRGQRHVNHPLEHRSVEVGDLTDELLRTFPCGSAAR